MKLDRTDTEILRLLQEDGRLSYRELARRVGVSTPTASARVANLERLGIVTGYHAAIDPDRLGQASVVLVVRCRPGRADAVARALAAMSEVRRAMRLVGDRVFAEAVLPRDASSDLLLEEIRRVDGVDGCEAHAATARLKDAPRAVVTTGIAAVVPCFECRQPIEGEPLRLRLDGRVHFLCCPTCARLYRQRYARLRAGARAPRRRAPARASARRRNRGP